MSYHCKTIGRFVNNGAAVPSHTVSFGSDDFASFLGADLALSPVGNTTWPVHTLTSLKNPKIKFDRNSKWWTKVAEFHYILKKTLGEDVIVAAPTLTGGLDAITALYGAENLLYDLTDDPAAVRNALAEVNAAYDEILDECARLFEFNKYGSINRHGMYSAGRVNLPQCDFSCMISPEMFEEFAMLHLEHEFNALDGGEYHLDGPQALKHLERLAKIDKLHVVQWVAGAGLPEKQDWTWLYKKIVSLGKGLILGGDAEHMVNMQGELNTPRLFASVHGIKSKGEAEEFLGKHGGLHYEK